MSPNSPHTPSDALLAQYETAKTLLPDGLPEAPSAATRESIMRAARDRAASSTIISIASHADSIRAKSQKDFKNTPESTRQTAPAANDSFWNIKAVASLAVMGLSALLWWQFENGTPEEQQAAASSLPNTAAVAAAAPTSEPAIQATASAARTSPTISPVDVAISASSERVRATSKATTPQVADKPATADAAPVTLSAPTTAPVPPNTDLRQYAEAQTAANAASAAPPSPQLQRKSSEVASTPAAARSATPAALALIPPPDALFSAIAARQAQDLQQALAQGASPNARNQEGQPALSQAVIQRWTEGVRILLAAGADKSAKNNKGHTASDVALELGYADMAELLAAPR
jgi:hypothetical protein